MCSPLGAAGAAADVADRDGTDEPPALVSTRRQTSNLVKPSTVAASESDDQEGL